MPPPPPACSPKNFSIIYESSRDRPNVSRILILQVIHSLGGGAARRHRARYMPSEPLPDTHTWVRVRLGAPCNSTKTLKRYYRKSISSSSHLCSVRFR
ncbi:hypothetical protein E2C01_097892 [Portunus trituberculatus]|uniref:Uncharacterized protein n=1 Tax=Portunus trituberculatus TaxID=210409 RepID=A0A5B7KCK0_PORTR|nr:hypothetical protein [Portunus trituberculatus]